MNSQPSITDQLDLLDIRELYNKLHYLFTKLGLANNILTTTDDHKNTIINDIWKRLYEVVKEHNIHVNYIYKLNDTYNDINKKRKLDTFEYISEKRIL